jgi:hypothetical protein
MQKANVENKEEKTNKLPKIAKMLIALIYYYSAE